MQRSAEVAVKKPPLADRVDLHIETVENSAQAQINSLNNIIAAKPDAILVHAASLDALNPTIEAACAAGIVVISFSQVVTAPCPYKLNTNWDSVNHDIPVWLANVLGGKGKIIVDRGLPGSPISEASNKEIEKVLAGFPGIEIVGWYTSNYALGDEQSGVASLLAANPQIDGILTAGYGTGAIQALKDAGRPLVPIVMFAYNGSATECATEKEPGAQVLHLHAPALSLGPRRSSSPSISSTDTRRHRRPSWATIRGSPRTSSRATSRPAPTCASLRSASTCSPICRRAWCCLPVPTG